MKDFPKQHAVEDGKINYLSVSQLKKFMSCERRWWFDKVAHLKEETTSAQKMGTDIHAELEYYLNTGDDSRLSKRAQAGLEHLPPPGSDLGIEWSIEGLTAGDIPLVGFVDLVNLRRLESDKLVEIIDHKTTKDIKKNAMSGVNIANDLQMLGYGEWARRKFHAHTLELSHVYYQTYGNAKAAKHFAVVSAGEVKKRWEERTNPLVPLMKKAAAEKDFTKLAPNLNSCYSYGRRCPYYETCQPEGKTGKKAMGKLFEALSAKEKQAGDAKIANAFGNASDLNTNPTAFIPEIDPPKEPVPPPPPTPGAPMSENKFQDALNASTPGVVAALKQLAEQAQGKGSGKSAVNPPDAAPSGGPAEDSKKGKGKGKAANQKLTIALFVDCIPSSGDCTDLAKYTENLRKQVCEMNNVADPALIEYGKGKGFMRALALDQPPEPGNYLVRLNDLTAPIIEALAGVEGVLIVRGIK